MRILFLVNGSENSAAAGRTRAFAERLPRDWSVRLAYRPPRKWKGLLPFVRLAMRFRPQVVYVMDLAYTGVLAGWVYRNLSECRLVVDTGDAVSELARSMGIYSPLQMALIQWVEQIAVTRSDCVVVRGTFHQELLTHSNAKRVDLVPDGVDLQAIKPVDSRRLRSKLALTDHLVVGMVGTMSWSQRHQMCYGWDIIEALGSLRDLAIKALLVGDGEGRPILEERSRQLGVRDRVVFAGTVPYAELPDYIAAMDVCVSTQSNDVVGNVRTTGKLPLYLACNRYVIATDAGEARRVLPGVGCLLPYSGIRDDGHPARLAAQLRRLYGDCQLLEVGEGPRSVAEKEFSYDTLAARVSCLCQGLIADRSGPAHDRLHTVREAQRGLQGRRDSRESLQ